MVLKMFKQIVIFTVAITLTSCGATQIVEVPVDQFTRDDYLGLWYIIREMVPKSAPTPVTECAHINVAIRGYNSWKFRQEDTRWENDVPVTRSAAGTMQHSEIHLKLNPDEDDTVLTVMKYNNGDELIILGKENRLLSRTKTASPETIRAFRHIALRQNMLIIPVTFDTC